MSSPRMVNVYAGEREPFRSYFVRMDERITVTREGIFPSNVFFVVEFAIL